MAEGGILKLGDFGIARVLAPGASAMAQTSVGTPYYLSPGERLRKASRAEGNSPSPLPRAGVPPLLSVGSPCGGAQQALSQSRGLRSGPALTRPCCLCLPAEICQDKRYDQKSDVW